MKNTDNSNPSPTSSMSTFNKIRAGLEKLLLKVVRLYTFYTPIDKGKYRLAQTTLRFCRYLPPPTTVSTTDGRKISANLSTGIHTSVYFYGEYEKALSRIVASLLKEDDVCIDVGANFGWYTTLFYLHCGKRGSVHAFEPVPITFEELKTNYELMGRPENVFINNFALGDENKDISINLFPGLATGYASLSRHGREDFVSFPAKMITLDSYLDERKITRVDFVKVDVEGGELMFLKGAEKLFRQAAPPILLMEMAFQQTQSFGYRPNDLIDFVRSQTAYNFYKVDEVKGNMIEIEGFAADDIGANVIGIPEKRL